MSIAAKWSCRIQALNEKGEVIDERVIDNQLNTDNWGYFLAGIFSTTSQAGSKTIPISDTLGTFPTVYTYYYQSGGFSAFNRTDGGPAGPFFQLGSGATPATRADIVLQTPITGTQGLTATYLAGSGVVSMGGTISYAATHQPTECALYINWAEGIQELIFLIDHQVFAALAAALTFTVAWTITLD
jgi:hypothetical protein